MPRAVSRPFRGPGQRDQRDYNKSGLLLTLVEFNLSCRFVYNSFSFKNNGIKSVNDILRELVDKDLIVTFWNIFFFVLKLNIILYFFLISNHS